MELYDEISHEQDWRYFGDDSRGEADPSRCQLRKSPDKGIKKELDKLGYPPDVCDLGNTLYMHVTNGDVKKSELRKGITLHSLYIAYRVLGRPKTLEYLLKRFYPIERKAISQGMTFFNLRCKREYICLEGISAKNYIPDVLKKLSKDSIKQEHIDRVILLYDKIKDACPILNRGNPQSAAKSLVYYYLRRRGCMINPLRYGRIVGLSDAIVLRLSSCISAVLGTSTTVKLE
jgi:transcription initiation factor TFIIIB Brf1 subunit/transcription initiation factor TFIIB